VSSYVNRSLIINSIIMSTARHRWTIHPLNEQLKAKARRAGLWNLWISAGESLSCRSSTQLLKES